MLGVAAVGALLFDMLLLSNGLVTSMRAMLDRTGFDLRVTASDALPGQGPLVTDAVHTTAAIARLPTVRAAIALRFADAMVRREAAGSAVRDRAVSFQGIEGAGPRPWTLLRGRDLGPGLEVVVNDNVVRRTGVGPGDRLVVRPQCTGDTQALPPTTFTVAGVASFPFDSPNGLTIATGLSRLLEACGSPDLAGADVIMVASREEASTEHAMADLARAFPALQVVSNREAVGRFERGGFTYFRQISTVLTTVTVAFAVLLITVLLTVSVNQRLGDIAALRALGFSRRRVVADVFWESALIVGLGGALSLPLGGLLAVELDGILKRIPRIPADVHFFVFDPAALRTHVSLLAATAVLASLYPIRIVARLPISATLRDEVVG